jgi:hypothetical protein
VAASRRTGLEFSNYYKPNRWLTIDADIAFAKARFRTFDLVGDRVSGSVEVASVALLAVDHLGPWFMCAAAALLWSAPIGGRH